MNYKLHYDRLITRAKSRDLNKMIYVESHHIIPSSIGGSDDKSNLVDLLPEEHLLAHLLLVKMYPNSEQLLYAANIMSHSNGNEYQQRINIKTYGWLKRKYSSMMSERMIGENNPRFGAEVSDETRNKISCANKGKQYRLGKKHSLETKLKLSALRKESGLSVGKLNPMYSKTHSSVSKQKMSENRKGKATGESNYMFGKTHTDEIKRLLREKNLKMWKVVDLETGDIWIGKDIDEFCNSNSLNKGTMQDVARARRRNPDFNYTYRKRWICEYYM